MNFVLFGYYGFRDGYYAYGQYFKNYFKSVSFFPLIEFRDLLKSNKTTLNDLDLLISGKPLNTSKYSSNLDLTDVPKDIVLIAHNNDMLESLVYNDIKIIDYIVSLKTKYNFKLIQLNWDPYLTQKNTFHYFDLAFCADPNYFKISPKIEHFKQGFSPITTFYERDENYSCDVSFIGTNLYIDSLFPNQLLNRKVILDKIYEDKSIRLHIYGPSFLKEFYPDAYKGFIPYNECYKVFSNSKINLNISPLESVEFDDKFYYSERMPQILGCNAIMLSNNNFSPLLEPDLHYIYINNPNDILVKIKEILDNREKMAVMQENVKKIKDDFNYEKIIPIISNKIAKAYYKFAFFLLDHIYNISHLLAFMLDHPITLVYLVHSDESNNHYKIYQQESVLKHIIKLGFDYRIVYCDVRDIRNFLQKPYIFLNIPLNFNLTLEYNSINKKQILDESYEVKIDKINILENEGHGIDEEGTIYTYIMNNFSINDNFLEHVSNNKYKSGGIITCLDKKLNILRNIYKIDSNKKTIIFFDNYLCPFLTNKDADENPFGYKVCNRIIDQLIELKQEYNIILRFHPFNEFGTKVGIEFPNNLIENFILDFTPFELSVLYEIADIVISNRYTSSGLESIFSKCSNIIFIDYDFNQRKLPNNYIKSLTNELFEPLLNSGYIINNSMIPIIREDCINLIDIIKNNKFYKNVDEYLKKFNN